MFVFSEGARCSFRNPGLSSAVEDRSETPQEFHAGTRNSMIPWMIAILHDLIYQKPKNYGTMVCMYIYMVMQVFYHQQWDLIFLQAAFGSGPPKASQDFDETPGKKPEELALRFLVTPEPKQGSQKGGKGDLHKGCYRNTDPFLLQTLLLMIEGPI